jgi:hypothetical protein
MRRHLKLLSVLASLFSVAVICTTAAGQEYGGELDYQITDPCLVGDWGIWGDVCSLPSTWPSDSGSAGDSGSPELWPCWSCRRCYIVTQTEFTYSECCRGTTCQKEAPPLWRCIVVYLGTSNCFTVNDALGAGCRGNDKCY